VSLATFSQGASSLGENHSIWGEEGPHIVITIKGKRKVAEEKLKRLAARAKSAATGERSSKGLPGKGKGEELGQKKGIQHPGV